MWEQEQLLKAYNALRMNNTVRVNTEFLKNPCKLNTSNGKPFFDYFEFKNCNKFKSFQVLKETLDDTACVVGNLWDQYIKHSKLRRVTNYQLQIAHQTCQEWMAEILSQSLELYHQSIVIEVEKNRFIFAQSFLQNFINSLDLLFFFQGWCYFNSLKEKLIFYEVLINNFETKYMGVYDLSEFISNILSKILLEHKILRLVLSKLLCQRNLSSIDSVQRELLFFKENDKTTQIHNALNDSLLSFSALQENGHTITNIKKQNDYVSKFRAAKVSIHNLFLKLKILSITDALYDCKLAIDKSCCSLLNMSKLRYNMLNLAPALLKSDTLVKKFYDSDVVRKSDELTEKNPGNKWAFYYANETWFEKVDHSNDLYPPFTYLILDGYFNKDIGSSILKENDTKKLSIRFAPVNDGKNYSLNEWLPVIFTNYDLSEESENKMKKQIGINCFVCRPVAKIENKAARKKKNKKSTSTSPSSPDDDMGEVHILFGKLCRAILSTTVLAEESQKSLRPIGSILVTIANGKISIIGHEMNRVMENDYCKTKLYHAETNLIWKFSGQFEKQLFVYTSLKPCALCSCVMFRALALHDGRVFYVHDDDGENSKVSIFPDGICTQIQLDSLDEECRILNNKTTNCAFSQKSIQSYFMKDKEWILSQIMEMLHNKSPLPLCSNLYRNALEEAEKLLLFLEQ